MTKDKQEILKEEYERMFTSQKYAYRVNRNMDELWIMPAMDSYAQMVAIDFLNNIRDYERENREQICYDERTSKELFNLFFQDNK